MERIGTIVRTFMVLIGVMILVSCAVVQPARFESGVAILELLKLALVGLVSGLFSYYLSARKHKSEKWWELRVTAYQEVIAALSDLYYYFNNYFRSESSQRDMSDEKEKDLKALWEDAYHKVRKGADAGAFLFSTEAETALKTFIKPQKCVKMVFCLRKTL